MSPEYFEDCAKRLQDSIDRHLGSGEWKFLVTEEERESFRIWNEEHLAKYHASKEPYCGAVGGRVTFAFTPTSLGTMVGAECGYCLSRKVDRLDCTCCLTDFSYW